MTQQRFPDGAADVWLGLPEEVDERALAVLSAAERNRVRLLRGPAAASYAAAHLGLRRILGGYLGTEPDQLKLGRTLCPECADPAHGPPAVVWPRTRLTFNLSRADGHWLLGVSEGSPIGVDLEAEPRIDPELTAPLAFTERELAHLRGLPAERQREAFLRCWTRKEAVVKAVGVGLAADLTRIEVHPDFPGPVLVRYGVAPGPTAWTLEEPDFGPDLHAALARVDGSTGPVRTFRYGADPLPRAEAPLLAEAA
ncbi:4'-phosphopantetheinyl transferase family protein [Kitasatospora sp. NPDC048365]|uniref:4'-phosphopantetheinyl transferase family protein n=1 Tax=Kitasatospora sp. NPDC048365 TaxID=3364050 RepID=UPI00371C07AA